MICAELFKALIVQGSLAKISCEARARKMNPYCKGKVCAMCRLPFVDVVWTMRYKRFCRSFQFHVYGMIEDALIKSN